MRGAPLIQTQTQLCISLASRPGNFGNLFHNWLYQQLGLDFIYKSCSTSDLGSAIAGVRALNIRGCGVSMPYKVEAMTYLDAIDPDARVIGAINTIVNDGGRLVGFNTDFAGVYECVRAQSPDPAWSVSLLGSGGMAQATLHALMQLGLRKVTVFSRNAAAGAALAGKYDLPWKKDFTGAERTEMLVNCTPIGMGAKSTDSEAVPFPTSWTESAELVCDVVANPVVTPWLKQASDFKRNVATGFEMTTIQAREQFKLYTGVTPSAELVAEAMAFVRSKTA